MSTALTTPNHGSLIELFSEIGSAKTLNECRVKGESKLGFRLDIAAAISHGRSCRERIICILSGH